MTRRFPLHIHISTLFFVLLLLVGSLIAWSIYRLSVDAQESAAGVRAEQASQETLKEISNLLEPVEMAVELLAYHRLTMAPSLGTRFEHLPLLRDALVRSPMLSSLYVGYPNGDFFMLRRFQDDADRKALQAPPEAAYLVQSIEHMAAGASRGAWIYLGESLQVLREVDRPEYPAEYSPLTRAWYRDALASPGMVGTEPYAFFTTGKVGLTLAMRAKDGSSVVGADVRLERLGRSLATHKTTPGTELAIVNPKGEVLVHEAVERLARPPLVPGALLHAREFGVPILAQLAETLSGRENKLERLRIAAGGDHWQASVMPLKTGYRMPMLLIIAIPESEMFAPAIELRNHVLQMTLLVILLAIPVAWFVARLIAAPLRRLAVEADSIRRFEFVQPITVRSLVAEVAALAHTMDGMKRTIRRFLDLSAAVAAEEDFDRLMPLLLDEAMGAAGAEAGVLYLFDEPLLKPAVVRGGEGSGPQPVPAASPGPLLGSALRSGQPAVGALDGEDVRTLGLDAIVGAAAARQAVAVPLINRRHQLVGALLLLRRDPIEGAQLSFVRALSGSAATSLEAREMIKAQKDLFEAMIQLIAGAIDAKSPYTGGHCARVPELTKMLARAACAQQSGPYADFSLSEEQWEAVHVASWLHDCGKVTTPEYVVDKATKLETLNDRIHEVRTRFEVLKRDAEIASLRAQAAGADRAAEEAKLAAALRALDDDFAFVAECNLGGEFMAPEKVARLQAIAARTWQRTLDDRLGVSHEELLRMQRVPAAPLPATETLLADKPEHVIERRPEDRIPDDNPWGFRIQVPERLYNRGELYNLVVARGTLSEEERYKINEHMVQTIKMLSGLPFPKHLREVPEIAGGHHEKMDGTGYPKRLKREDMSPVARMMAIADIFEALTAADRPYKKAKPLSEAIRIMAGMKKGQHVDPELFDLFLTSGVYLDYARRFLRPEQIDAVDIASYVGASPA